MKSRWTAYLGIALFVSMTIFVWGGCSKDKGKGGGSSNVYDRAKSQYKSCKKKCGADSCDQVGVGGYGGGFGYGGGLESIGSYKQMYGDFNYNYRDDSLSTAEKNYFEELEDARIPSRDVTDMIEMWKDISRDCYGGGMGGGGYCDPRYQWCGDGGGGWCDPRFQWCGGW